MSLPDADLTVVGAGVVGLAIALTWKELHPAERVVVLDKERALARHASGRNSGVLHSGVYYPPDTLKARFTRAGNEALARLCEEEGLPIRRCGKLIVARKAADLPVLDELAARASAGGIEVERLDEEGVRRVEPRARTHEGALFVRSTAVVDPVRVTEALAARARDLGVTVHLGAGFESRDGEGIRTALGSFGPGFVVNAAGLQADRVAKSWGFGERYTLLPFRGLYLEAAPEAPGLSCHIYPVPDLELPFLGVHFTVTAAGRPKIGPTAQPALWREQYRGLEGFSTSEAVEIGWMNARKLLGDRRFRTLAAKEIAHGWRRSLLREAAWMVDAIEPRHWTRWRPPGIRAQLVDRQTGELVMDFLTEGDRGSFHVLNGISPGFTCCLPFARWCCDTIEAARG